MVSDNNAAKGLFDDILGEIAVSAVDVSIWANIWLQIYTSYNSYC